MVERNLRLAPQVTKTSKIPLPKLFVLDTNVLMHDPTSLYRFEEHDIFLPMLTLEELDSNKKGVTEVARNARQASRYLDELVTAAVAISGGDISAGIPLKPASGGAATEAKITAARELSVPVVMVRRPPPEPGDAVETVEAAVDWLSGEHPFPEAERVS